MATCKDGLIGIGEAALRTGASERALRYYEEIGLLLPAQYSPGGNRRYSDAELARVVRIRELQDLMGFNLDEIGEILLGEDRLEALRAQWHASADEQERRRILEDGIAATEPLQDRVVAKRDRLGAFLVELGEKVAHYRSLLAELSDTTECEDPREASRASNEKHASV